MWVFLLFNSHSDHCLQFHETYQIGSCFFFLFYQVGKLTGSLDKLCICGLFVVKIGRQGSSYLLCVLSVTGQQSAVCLHSSSINITAFESLFQMYTYIGEVCNASTTRISMCRLCYSGISKQVISIIISSYLFVCLFIASEVHELGGYSGSRSINLIRLNVFLGERLQHPVAVVIEGPALILFLVTFDLCQLLRLHSIPSLANEVVVDVVKVKFVEQNYQVVLTSILKRMTSSRLSQK